MDHLLDLWPDHSGWYFGVTMPLNALMAYVLMGMTDHTFLWLYLFAFAVLAILSCLSAGFGLAQYLQNRFRERRLVKNAEQFLYDERI